MDNLSSKEYQVLGYALDTLLHHEKPPSYLSDDHKKIAKDLFKKVVDNYKDAVWEENNSDFTTTTYVVKVGLEKDQHESVE